MYSIPSGYQVENIPDNVDVSDEHIGSYSLKITADEQKIIVQRKFHRNAVTLPAEDYHRLCDFYTKIGRADRGKIVLIKTP